MSEGLARRLCPIGNTFINVPACRIATARRRTQSFPGYIALQCREDDVLLPGDLDVAPEEQELSFSTGSSESFTTTESEGPQSFCEALTERGTPTLRQTIDEEFTTLMIRNLPHNLTQMDVIAELDESGFEGTYDFFYMPSNFGSGRGKGYAFVNFTQQEVARRFVNEWHRGVRFGVGRVRGGLSISAASVQGREANVTKWDVPRMRRVKNPNYRPLIAVKPTGGGPCVLVPSCLIGSEAAVIAEVPRLGGVAR